MRFYRGVVIASWKLYPIPRADDLKNGRQAQFLKAPTGAKYWNQTRHTLEYLHWTRSIIHTKQIQTDQKYTISVHSVLFYQPVFYYYHTILGIFIKLFTIKRAFTIYIQWNTNKHTERHAHTNTYTSVKLCTAITFFLFTESWAPMFLLFSYIYIQINITNVALITTSLENWRHSMDTH